MATAAHKQAHGHRGAQMLCNQHTDWTVLRLHAITVGWTAKPSGSFLEAFFNIKSKIFWHKILFYAHAL